MDAATDLTGKHCKPCEGGVSPMTQTEAEKLMRKLEGWSLHDKAIDKTFAFKDHYQTMAFVNGVAWVSHREDHHPEMTVGYSKCRVEYSTHAIGGLSENDFICAAKVDALLKV